LPDRDLAIEVNGTFWHADPRVYPNGPVKPSQRRTLTRYTRKLQLLKGLGIRVVEVWEADFKADPIPAVQAALIR
jgi:G:T-mismatch repair DNA endonuclease (very short patch repair protein)